MIEFQNVSYAYNKGYGVNNLNTLPFNNLPYESINSMGKQWIRKYALALMEDLDQRGLLETTIVMVMGEFGRTPHLNPNHGRDHWPECWSVALGGGGIRGGQIVGASDETGGYVAERMVTMGDLLATVYKALGIDWHKELMSPTGRPIKISNSIDDTDGIPIEELV